MGTSKLNIYKTRFSGWIILIFAGLFAGFSVTSAQLPDKDEVLNTMILVNDYWINEHIDPGDWEWNRAAYFTGNMALYHVYPDQKYMYYALTWGENNNWTLKGGSTTRHADNQCIGQTYLDLYELDPDPDYIESIQLSIENMVNSTKKDDWYWIDAFYMAMPVFTRLGVLNDNEAYFEKMYDLYYDTKYRRGLFNDESGLWFRDENFDPPYTTPNGKDCYWSRGNGWVFGAHVRVLDYLPVDDPHRDEYISTFREMAEALADVQRSDGFWNVSLADPDDYGGPETSGTSFFTYGLAWGINNGYLDSADYYPVVVKAWNGLSTIAVHEDGFLGYVQKVGKEPASSQPVTYEITADFGVGAFLLAGSEVYKLAGGEPAYLPETKENLALNKVAGFSDQENANEAFLAADGNVLTKWSAEFFPQWIEIDLEDTYNIYRTEIIPYRNRAYQYLISAKELPGEDYTILVDRLENEVGGVVLADTFDCFPAKFVKLTITGCDGYDGDWASIIEFRVFGNKEATAVSEEISPPGIRLFPNPSTGMIFLHIDKPVNGNVQLQVHNITGQMMMQRVIKVRPGIQVKTEISLSGLAPGMYFIRIYSGNQGITEKLILK